MVNEFCERQGNNCDRCVGLATNAFTRTLGERSATMTLADATLERENAKLRALVLERNLGELTCELSQQMSWDAGENLANHIVAKYERTGTE
jgi:hypothetical protein